MNDVTLLYRYMSHNNVKQCENLLKQNPYLYKQFSDCYIGTPLRFAVKSRYSELIKLFAHLGYSVNEYYDGMYLIDYATEYPDCKELETLLICGADPNTISSHIDRGLTILSKIIMHNTFETKRNIKILMRYGADPNIQDILGYNSLHYAVKTFNNKNVKTLLKYRVNCYAKNDNKMTPLDLANTWYCEDIIKSLQDYDMNIRKCVNLLEMARYFDENSLIHEDYFPLDLLKIFIQMMQHKI